LEAAGDLLIFRRTELRFRFNWDNPKLSSKRGKIKQAVILAGGEGRRLRPYTKVLPKPLLPIGSTPIIEVLLGQLSMAGIRDIIIAVGYQAELMKLILGNGSRWDLKIKYSMEKRPLGTAGPLKKIDNLDANFLVLNGDLLTDMAFEDFMAAHLENDCLATIAVNRRSVKVDFGVVEGLDDLIYTYREKPILRYRVSMGIYAFRREILKFIPPGKFDFPDLVKKLIRANRNPAVYHYQGRWYDIGRPEDWEKADRIFRRRPKIFLT
jgi:NDP-sugar pyrophosphorylase family protein